MFEFCIKLVKLLLPAADYFHAKSAPLVSLEGQIQKYSFDVKVVGPMQGVGVQTSMGCKKRVICTSGNNDIL